MANPMILSALRYEDLRKEVCEDIIGIKEGALKTLNSNSISNSIIEKQNNKESTDIDSKKPIDIDSKKPIFIKDKNQNQDKDDFHFVKQSDSDICETTNTPNTDNNPIFPENTDGMIIDPSNHDTNNPIDGRTPYKDDPDFFMRFVKPIEDSINKIKSKFIFF